MSDAEQTTAWRVLEALLRYVTANPMPARTPAQ